MKIGIYYPDQCIRKKFYYIDRDYVTFAPTGKLNREIIYN